MTDPAATPPSGPECYRRACTLLEQAFATHVVQTGDPWAAEPRVEAVLDHDDQVVYIAAAQAYATLAQASATAAHTGARGPGDLGPGWSEVLGWG